MEGVSDISGKSVLVVGAGVAGLTAGEELTRQGASVTIIEREEQVGGLARSFRHDGVTFDLGPHRFHTDDEGVEGQIRDVLGMDIRLIDRSSAVWLYNSYHDWPLARASLLKLPPMVMVQAALDLFRRPHRTDDSLESYVLSKYGKTLYDIFFKPYTEKFLTYRCNELHSDWASAGINRAVIDKRYRFDSLFNVAKTTLLPPPVHTRFIYPESGGVDRYPEALASRIGRGGGQVITSSSVAKLERQGQSITAAITEKGERLAFDHLIWTAPLPLLLDLLELPPSGLEYLRELIFNFVVRGRPALPYQWTYYGGAALSFMRASLPTYFSPSNDGSGTSGVCLEVVCQEGDELWDEPSLLRRNLEYDMVRVGLVRQRQDVLSMHVERIPEAYPIYILDYPARLRKAVADVVGCAENVLLLGRTGTFWYNNMDHSIRQAMDLSRALGDGVAARKWNTALGASRAL